MRKQFHHQCSLSLWKVHITTIDFFSNQHRNSQLMNSYNQQPSCGTGSVGATEKRTTKTPSSTQQNSLGTSLAPKKTWTRPILKTTGGTVGRRCAVFNDFLYMDPAIFQEAHQSLEERISRKDTWFRKVLIPGLKLVITNYHSLMYSFRVVQTSSQNSFPRCAFVRMFYQITLRSIIVDYWHTCRKSK